MNYEIRKMCCKGYNKRLRCKYFITFLKQNFIFMQECFKQTRLVIKYVVIEIPLILSLNLGFHRINKETTLASTIVKHTRRITNL